MFRRNRPTSLAQQIATASRVLEEAVRVTTSMQNEAVAKAVDFATTGEEITHEMSVLSFVCGSLVMTAGVLFPIV